MQCQFESHFISYEVSDTKVMWGFACDRGVDIEHRIDIHTQTLAGRTAASAMTATAGALGIPSYQTANGHHRKSSFQEQRSPVSSAVYRLEHGDHDDPRRARYYNDHTHLFSVLLTNRGSNWFSKI